MFSRNIATFATIPDGRGVPWVLVRIHKNAFLIPLIDLIGSLQDKGKRT